jgi:hypothetical protein
MQNKYHPSSSDRENIQDDDRYSNREDNNEGHFEAINRGKSTTNPYPRSKYNTISNLEEASDSQKKKYHKYHQKSREIDESIKMLEDSNADISKSLRKLKRGKFGNEERDKLSSNTYIENERGINPDFYTLRSDLIIIKEENQRLVDVNKHYEEELSKQRARK